MVHTILGIFFVLHGLVHLLYFALSRKVFELEPPLVGWPDQSWLFSSFLAVSGTRLLASVLYGLATLSFVIAGFSFLANATWANTLLIGAAIFSSVVIFFFWDGQWQRLPDKGFVGIAINLAVVVLVILLERSIVTL